ncbi:MAG: hypothetical protein ABIZ07_03315 [Dermatophilaceae bacterium]
MSDFLPYRPDPLANDFGSIPYEPPTAPDDEPAPELAAPSWPSPPAPALSPYPAPPPYERVAAVETPARPDPQAEQNHYPSLAGWVKFTVVAFIAVILLAMLSASPDESPFGDGHGAIVPSLSDDPVVFLPASTAQMTVEVTGPDRTASIYISGLDTNRVYSDIILPLGESMTVTSGQTITITATLNGAIDATPLHCRLLVDGELVSEATADQTVECTLTTT